MLEVRSEKDHGRVYELRKERTTIGRSRDSDIFLDDVTVSRNHAVLVERYLEILRAKKVSVDNIVAITFTNRAANEMRQRVRERIDGLLRESSDRERQTWLRHKRTLEGAVITTIHGFCSRLLHEFPVEANIDPQFVLLDEHQLVTIPFRCVCGPPQMHQRGAQMCGDFSLGEAHPRRLGRFAVVASGL
jgi:uncharacterized metal-binding protein YceD (DUF177 family)